ncbi:hypothetical protein C2E23DRAFT_842082 [Lenzites betulinus]|nr:hypothetical protein C2E23DRAFT_842082 [Lenzites betulinus]
MTAQDTSDMGQDQSQANPETPLVPEPRNRRRRGLKQHQPSSASSGDANEASHVSEFRPTLDDVHALRYIFVQLGLPAELIFHILDEAAYYPTIYASLLKLPQNASDRPLKVSARECVAKQHCAARLCMVSSPMPHGTPGETWRAKAVIWDIQSHDQGWGGDHPGMLGFQRVGCIACIESS